MRNILLQEDVNLIESQIKKFESNTGCELLLVVAKESDPYPGASWRFGLIAGFIVSLIFSYYLEFHQGWMWPVGFLMVSLFMTWIGHYNWAKKLALSDWEMDRECREKAVEHFHTLGVSRVSHKVTAMIMVSVLEKKIEVLVDDTLTSRITQAELDQLVEIMKKHFSAGHMGLGLTESIKSLEEKILLDFGGKVSEINPGELSDKVHFV